MTVESAEWLESRDLVIARRSRAGVIVHVQYHGAEHTRVTPQRRPKSGTRYSFQRVYAGGRKVWELSPLPYRLVASSVDTPEVADMLIRAIFSKVSLSTCRLS